MATVRQTSLQPIQFTDKYDGEKLRRMMDGIIVLQRSLNELISQFNALNNSVDNPDPVSISLDDLTDVSVAGATAGLVLTKSGSDWVASPIPAPAMDFSSLGDLAFLDTLAHSALTGLAIGDPHPQYELRNAYAKHFLMMGA